MSRRKSLNSDILDTRIENRSNVSMRGTPQGVFWILTIPEASFSSTSSLPTGVAWIKGQLEEGTGGFRHWQLIVAFNGRVRRKSVREAFGPFHAELTRSEAAEEYVWKEDTRVPNTQFQIGARPIRRNSKRDYELIWKQAKEGDLESICPSVRVQHYRTIRQIAADYAAPTPMERSCSVYWGPTGTGKSRRAWDEAGMDAYPKDPRTKFWCGYSGQVHVVLDEFRGGIDISHLLRWLDRYPVVVEVKGSSTVFKAKKIWITSNLAPSDWYPGIDEDTKDALLRRLEVTHFNSFFS